MSFAKIKGGKFVSENTATFDLAIKAAEISDELLVGCGRRATLQESQTAGVHAQRERNEHAARHATRRGRQAGIDFYLRKSLNGVPPGALDYAPLGGSPGLSPLCRSENRSPSVRDRGVQSGCERGKCRRWAAPAQLVDIGEEVDIGPERC